jgi:phosphoglycolate phosphatase-like HAD superfamily hydrolase
MIDFKRYKYVIFDLDNTIYNETAYLFHAYEEIAKQIEKDFAVESSKLSHFLKITFEKSGRKDLFNLMISEFSLPDSCLSMCLSILRNIEVPDQLEIFPVVLQFFYDSVDSSKKLFVITNGNPDQQRNKIRQINWHGMDSNISFIFANETHPKPNPFSFQLTSIGKNELNTTVFIGDSLSDQQFAENIGIDFIYIHQLVQHG